MRVQIILNPYSDQGRAGDYAARLRPLNGRYGAFDLVLTERPRHGQELARQAALDRYDLVVAAGGDGTVHEVVNGLVAAGKPGPKLGLLPVGSGNDFAYGVGAATDLETAVSRLFSGQSRPVDLGHVVDNRGREEVFTNNFGIGFDAMVVIRTAAITRVHGFLMYLTAVLQTIMFDHQSPLLEMTFDGNKMSRPVLFLTLGIGPRHGGGFFLTPDARSDDNQIDSCLVNPVSRLTMLRMLMQAVKGTHVTSRHVTMGQSERIVIQADQPLPIHIDGEVFAYPEDNVTRLTITSLPEAIEVIV